MAAWRASRRGGRRVPSSLDAAPKSKPIFRLSTNPPPVHPRRAGRYLSPPPLLHSFSLSTPAFLFFPSSAPSFLPLRFLLLNPRMHQTATATVPASASALVMAFQTPSASAHDLGFRPYCCSAGQALGCAQRKAFHATPSRARSCCGMHLRWASVVLACIWAARLRICMLEPPFAATFPPLVSYGRTRRTSLHILTSLQEYRGPDDFLHALLPIPSLRRLFLPCEDPSRRLAKLRSIETPNNVTSLNVQFRDFDHESLRELCGFFPHLTNLFIIVTIPPVIEYDFEEWHFDQNPSWEVHDFFGSLTEDLPFPLGIRKLAIHWEFEDDKALIEEGVPDFHALADALVSKYPSIKAIWVDGPPGCLYHWRDGEVKVQCLEGDSKDTYWERAYSLSNELNVFWDTI
ncbi:hypothetical protein B0H11DRAFT_767742 [Mycena galericulata]|nr:hypothetical protein B0H11DRAFT_767742 [Mycena galericulata]